MYISANLTLSLFGWLVGVFVQVDHLKGWVRNSFTSLAMVDYPYPASFLAPLPAYPVKTSCGIILGAKNRAVGLAQGAGQTLSAT